jgi:DnaJ like chaperone protein
MGIMAKADGRVSQSELNFANHIFKQLKINSDQMNTAKQWFTASKNGQVSLEDQARLLQYLKEMNLGLCKNCFDIAYQMAKIDGLNPEKIVLLNQLLHTVGFIELDPFQSHNFNWQNQRQNQREQQNYRRQEYTPPPRTNSLSLEQAYSILNVAIDANKTQVKQAYRKLISKYHPDKMIAKGASKQEIKAATEKTQQISKAYQLICDTKGW